MIHLKELSTKTNGFDLSRIGLGTMRLAADQQAGVDTIHAALDAGSELPEYRRLLRSWH
ncbi:MAG: hypothetical protein ACLVEJ_11135 [Parabacteroides sp.]